MNSYRMFFAFFKDNIIFLLLFLFIYLFINVFIYLFIIHFQYK